MKTETMRQDRFKGIATKASSLKEGHPVDSEPEAAVVQSKERSKHSRKVTFRLTEAEYDALYAAAENKGASISTYCRMMIRSNLALAFQSRPSETLRET